MTKEILAKTDLAEQVISKAKTDTIQGGTFYIVPPSKYGFYENGAKPIVIDVTPEQAVYLSSFINPDFLENPQVWGDLELALPYVVSRKEIGLEDIERIEQGLLNLVGIPSIILKDPRFLDLLDRNLSETDKDKLEFSSYDPDKNYLTEATIVRADLLLNKDDGVVFSCDPNLVPLGYSIVENIAASIESQTGIPVKARPDYIEGIHKLASKYPNNISGIVTGLNYANWNSHAGLAKQIRDKHGDAFYVIPTEAMNSDGSVDFVKLNKFNLAFGIDAVDGTISNIPGMLIRYVRETTNFHPATEVTNASGIRLLETQIWGGLISLPGFVEIAGELGITPEQIESARKIVSPSLIGKVENGKLLIADGLSESAPNGKVEFVWVEASQRLDIFENALREARNKEKPNELTWYVKTFSTSGKKGVRFTNDGRIDQAEKNILKIIGKMEIPDSSIFLIQPKIRSVINDPVTGDELRVKIDLFLSLNTGKTVLVDYMATPISQRAAHGSSSTRIGLVTL